MSRTKPKPAGSNLTNTRDETTAAPEVTEQKADLLIRDLWQQGTDSVHDMHVVNTDALSYVRKSPEKCLHEAERGKKKMYLEACLQKRQYFSPFVALVDGLLGVEATATLKRIASRLATKWRHPTQRSVDTSRVGLPSSWCVSLIAVYADPGCLYTGSVCSNPSGKMG